MFFLEDYRNTRTDKNIQKCIHNYDSYFIVDNLGFYFLKMNV